AVTMSQFAARQYTKWMSILNNRFYRLPMRSEHIHACRLGSNESEERAAFVHPFDIGSRVAEGKPDRLGIFDLRRNVAEWVIEQDISPIHQEHVAMGNFIDGVWLEACDCEDATRSNTDWWIHDPDFPQSPHWAASEEAKQTGFRIVRPFKAPKAEEWTQYHDPDTEDLASDVLSRLDEGRNLIVRVKTPDNLELGAEK
ncbi:MAG: formylglycine-generating enzyme family protein, partial [Planctomycetota bacterium]